jgi:NAD(P)-dependent dehydrogenase (short-subunit alcohol dehydrogenase family)
MISNGYGRIINISSGWGSFNEGLGGPFSYSTTKTALNALTHTISSSVQQSNIKINAMCPGWVRTRMGGAEAPRSPGKGAETALWLATL